MATRALWLFMVAPQIKTADDSHGGSKLNSLPNIRMSGMTTIKPKNSVGLNKIHSYVQGGT